MTSSEFSVEQYSVGVDQYNDTIDLNMVDAGVAIASIFAAQVAGIRLTWAQQAVMVFTLMLTSKGIAGVPRATLMILLATASQFHLPSAPILMILGVDALVDMGRTALNVTGNCLAAAVVGKWEQP